MASYITVPVRSDEMPRVIRVELPEGQNGSGVRRGDNTEAHFMAAWIRGWRHHEIARELRDQRVRFLVRMGAI